LKCEEIGKGKKKREKEEKRRRRIHSVKYITHGQQEKERELTK
jgi:hypothetical protein